MGAAYYWDMHNLKALLELGRSETEWDTYAGFIAPSSGNPYEDTEVWFLRIMFQLEW